MPFPKTCFSPLQIFPKTVAIGSPSRSRSQRRSRSRGPKPAAKIDHVTNVVVGSCCWLRVFLLHRIASCRFVSFLLVLFGCPLLMLPCCMLHAACCQVRLKRTFDWFVGGSDRERRKERERGRGAAPSCFLVEKGCFFSFCYFLFFWWRLSLSLLSYFRNRHYLPAKVKMPQSAANYER